MSEAFKSIKGINGVNYDWEFFSMSSASRTRGHKLNLTKDKFRTEIRKCFLFFLIVWNILPAHVVEAETRSVFKTRLDTEVYRWYLSVKQIMQ